MQIGVWIFGPRIQRCLGCCWLQHSQSGPLGLAGSNLIISRSYRGSATHHLDFTNTTNLKSEVGNRSSAIQLQHRLIGWRRQSSWSSLDSRRRATLLLGHRRRLGASLSVMYNSTSKTGQQVAAVSQKLRARTADVKQKIGDATRGMRENVLTIPNILCLSRIALSPVLAALVIYEYYPLACCCFVAAGITDLLDGFIARRFPSQQTVLGSNLDPLADKFLAGTLFLALTYNGLIPLQLTLLMITRDVMLICAAFWVRYVSLPHPRTLSTFFDVTKPTAKMYPTTISKWNTAIQLGLIAFTLGAPVFDYVGHPYLQAYWYLTAASTVVSGLSYVVQKNTFKVLGKKQL